MTEGLKRELREEIGPDVVVVHLAGVYSELQKAEMVLVFLCRLAADQAGSLRTAEEIFELGWFLPSGVLPRHRQHVEDAFAGQLVAILREQRSSTAEDQRLPEKLQLPSWKSSVTVR